MLDRLTDHSQRSASPSVPLAAEPRRCRGVTRPSISALLKFAECLIGSPLERRRRGAQVTLPGRGQSFALIYSIEDPSGSSKFSGVGVQVRRVLGF